MNHRIKHVTAGLLLALLIAVSALLPSSLADGGALLEAGRTVNSLMQRLSLVQNGEDQPLTSGIRAVRMAAALPENFVPGPENTVSATGSAYPVYIFFDNTDDAGVLYFYTEGSRISLNPDSSFLFAGLPVLTDLSGVTDWDSSGVIDMRAMFVEDKSLPDALALRNWDTSNVTDMSFLFSGDSALMYVDVSRWNTSRVTSMSGMFQVGENYQGDGQLREILGLGSLDVSSVTDMTCMFYGAGEITYYDVSDWDVSKVTSMNHMFCDNFKLRSLDLSRWNVSSVRTIHDMFDDCHALRTIGDVSRWNTASLIDACGWLNYCSSFIGDSNGMLDLSGWDTGSLKAAGEMFLYTKVYTIDLSGWTFDAVTNDSWEGAGKGIYYESGNGSEALKGFGQMFKGTPNLTAVYVSQSALDSFNAAMEREVNTVDMWLDSKCEGFTVK